MSKPVKIFAVVIIAMTAFLAVSSSWNDSIIVDEVPHIGAGYAYVAKQDMRLNPEHPPLAKDMAGIPLLFLKLKETAFSSKFWQQDVNGQWDFGRLLIFNSGNDADQIKHWARLPLILFFVLAAILIFKWAHRLYGDSGGIIALVLFAFSPTVIAHSRFVTTDMAALFGVLTATYFFIRYLRFPRTRNLVWAGIFFGIALALKFSTFLLVPFFILLAIAFSLTKDKATSPTSNTDGVIKNLWRTIMVFLLGTAVLWGVYSATIYNYPAERQKRDTESILTAVYGGEQNIRLRMTVWASDKPVIRPLAQYALGLLRVTHQTLEPHDIYFLGSVRLFGSHAYFPIVYFLKESLAWWGLALISLLYLGWQTKKPSHQSFKRAVDFVRNHFDEFAMLLWLLIYWAVSIRGTLNIGVRHLLPIYPFTIILVSGQLSAISNRLKAHKTKFTVYGLLLSVLIGWYVFETIRIYPFYLTYFNQAAGGPSGGYRYVVDSNLDWGQDLIRFSNWVEENGIRRVEFDYFGWADPLYYMGERYVWTSATKYRDAEDFKLRNQSDGWLAVSATFLQTSTASPENYQPVNYNNWLHAYDPVTTIGNSIFVYRIK